MKMKITYLGTAAFEGVPALFCSCPVCEEARRLGGKNIRTRSQALINEDLLIDFNADTFTHFLKGNHDIRKVENCLITHSHCDHFYPDDMEMARTDFIHGEQHGIDYYAGVSAINQMKPFEIRSWMKVVMKTHLVEAYKPFKAGRYDVLPLPANHDPLSSPFIYAISDGEKKMLYGNDTWKLFDGCYPALQKFGRLDLVSLDCTGMKETGWMGSHMTLDLVLEVLDRMEKDGIIDDKTIRIVNHFSHNGGINHDAFEKMCEPYHILVSYDGMEIDF